jgi:hypothetical protein
MGFEFVHPFTFMQTEKRRVSHHLIFVSKSYKGYKELVPVVWTGFPLR